MIRRIITLGLLIGALSLCGCSGYWVQADLWDVQPQNHEFDTQKSIDRGEQVRVTRTDGVVWEGAFVASDSCHFQFLRAPESVEVTSVPTDSIAVVEVFHNSPMAGKVVGAAAVSVFVFAMVKGRSQGTFSPDEAATGK